jgi:hypothetical protein
MTPVSAVSQVTDAIQAVKTGASEFCTNIFPVQTKLQGWIDHAEVLTDQHPGAVFFVRNDRGFSHLFFCAENLPALQRALASLSRDCAEPLAVDLVGKEGGLDQVLGVFQSAAFRPYRRLVRLARTGASAELQPPASSDVQVVWAQRSDLPGIRSLLAQSFDRYADQLPGAYELDAALAARQILVVRCDCNLAALLFFETQGFTSTVRYWAVSEPFRSRRLGAALMHHYFAGHSAVRRFILWVTESNENAVRRYRHYGYAPDGLVDHVLVNSLIPA